MMIKRFMILKYHKLGLIYEVKIDGNVEIYVKEVSITTACPVTEDIALRVDWENYNEKK